MNEPASSRVSAPDFELPNVASGPNPFSLSTVAGDPAIDAVVLLFQRDYHCRHCRAQVRTIADRYDEFSELNTEVVSILPESTERTRSWQDSYELPFPLLADRATDVGNAYDQPVRFGVFGYLHDLVGRMPVALIVDARDSDLRIAYTYEGRMPADRPEIDELLDTLREL